MRSRSCPIEDCRVTIKAGHLMCRTHWFLIPPALRAGIASQWRTLRIGATRGNRCEARIAYRFARNEAISHVNRVEAETAEMQADAVTGAPGR